MTKIRKAVFPVAGQGTRFLPVTKSVPKEMLPLVDRPLIQYAIDEARTAGIEEFIFVTASGKTALEDYFDSASELEAHLVAKGNHKLAASLREAQLPEGSLSFVRQHQALGLGHAVWCARHLIGNEPFAVILPDDVIAAKQPCLAQMALAHETTGGNMIAAMEVPNEQISSYGILEIDEEVGRLTRARGMIEKPPANQAPSNLAAIGRYILQPSILERLSEIEPGAGGELQLTDAIAADIATTGLWGYRFDGERFDCGSKLGFLEATVAFGLARAEFADEFAAIISGRLPQHRRAA